MSDSTEDEAKNTRAGQVQDEEAPDEWTALADSYTSVLVPSFAPIYNAVVNELLQPPQPGQNHANLKVLDFGCGPGEPSLTIARKIATATVVGLDSTQPMLEIAKKRAAEQTDGIATRVTFRHVRRDVTMSDLVHIAGEGINFDMVVSTFVLHYVDFHRRVELVEQFCKMAQRVLIVTWGDQSQVGWLRAIKTFGTWKMQKDNNDICSFTLDPEDNESAESPTGSFTMCRKETFDGIVDSIPEARLESWDTKTIVVTFTSVKALLSFLPMPGLGSSSDIQAMWKLLKSWGPNHVTLGNDPEQAIAFPTDVVFGQIDSGSNSASASKTEAEGEASKRP